MMAVPLAIGGHGTGTLVFYYRTPHEFDEVEVQTARALGNLAAAAITSAELFEAQRRSREHAERANRQTAFLAEASAALGSSLDYEETLRTVAQLAVPQIADWCAVDIVDEHGEVQRLAVSHIDSAQASSAGSAVADVIGFGHCPDAAGHDRRAVDGPSADLRRAHLRLRRLRPHLQRRRLPICPRHGVSRRAGRRERARLSSGVGREPRQGRVPRDAVPRAPDAVERGARMGADAAGRRGEQGQNGPRVRSRRAQCARAARSGRGPAGSVAHDHRQVPAGRAAGEPDGDHQRARSRRFSRRPPRRASRSRSTPVPTRA